MYTITHNGGMFFDPRVDGYPVGNPRLSREGNRIGTLTFTVYPQHPEYELIRSLSSVFSVYKDGRLIFKGRPAYSRRTFRGGMEYKVEEVTAFMNDFKVRPMTMTGQASEFFFAVMNSYNLRTGVPILPGEVTVYGEITAEISEYPGHWEALQNYLVTALGGYMIPRYEGGKIYLDYLQESDLPRAAQSIRFGENLTDLFVETSSDDTFSAVIPFGGIPDGATEKVNITSVNGGSDYLVNEGAMALYGIRETTREWGDVTDPAELLRLAEGWLNDNAIKFRETVELSAIDLHNADANIESFSYMHWVHAESTLHDVSADYVATREEIPLSKPTGTMIRLGGSRRTFSESLSTAANSAQMAQEAASAASASSGAAASSAGSAEQAMAALMGGDQSNAVFWLYQSGQDLILKVNPAYKFMIQSYDVAAKLAQI